MADDMQGECEAFESLYQIKKRQKEEAMPNWGKDVSVKRRLLLCVCVRHANCFSDPVASHIHMQWQDRYRPGRLHQIETCAMHLSLGYVVVYHHSTST